MITFGDALAYFRSERGLSLRELDQLSGVDHAYIYRLERGDKTAPSANVMGSLSRALKLSNQRRGVLEKLLEIEGAVPDALFEAVLAHPDLSPDAFRTANQMSFRGERPRSVADWAEQMEFLDSSIFGNRD